MAYTCLLTDGNLWNCDTPEVGGVESFVILYNRGDWIDMVNGGNVVKTANIITAITNPSGVQGYRFDIPDETALMPSYNKRAVDGGRDGFDHLFNFSMMGTKQDQKENLLAMMFEKVVAIVYKKNGTGEVYGEEQGLELQNTTVSLNDPNIGAVIPVELATSTRTAPENFPPSDIFDTDAATTKALIEGLVTPGV